MSNHEERRERIRSAIGEELADRVGDEIAVSWPISTYAQIDGSITTYNWLTDREHCGTSSLLDVAGMSSTGADGEVTVSLNAHHCQELHRDPRAGENTWDYSEPVNVVVTSRESRRPVVLAARARIVARTPPVFQRDVVIEVSSWDLQGEKAGNIPFYWRCITGAPLSFG